MIANLVLGALVGIALFRTIPRRYTWVPIEGDRLGMIRKTPISRFEQFRYFVRRGRES